MGDLILAREAPVGNVAIITPGLQVCLGQRTVLIRPDASKVEPSFLLYLLLGRDVQTRIQAVTQGATVPHLNVGDIRTLELPVLPSREVQRRIAGILSAYDDLIENNTKRIKILEEMARSLYREWFETPNGKRQLRVAVVQKLIDDGVLEVNDGYRAKNTELGPPGLPFARAGNVNDGFHFEGADLLNLASVARAGSKLSRPGDVVFTSKGTVGRFASVGHHTTPFVYSPQLCYWRVVNPGVIDSRYLFRWMQSPAFNHQIDRVKGSTAMADYVSLTDQRRMLVDIPPSEALSAFSAQAEPIDGLVANLQSRNALLRRTRDLLLPRLISGELPVEAAK